MVSSIGAKPAAIAAAAAVGLQWRTRLLLSSWQGKVLQKATYTRALGFRCRIVLGCWLVYSSV